MIILTILLLLGIGFLFVFLLPTVFTIALIVLFVVIFYRLFKYIGEKISN